MVHGMRVISIQHLVYVLSTATNCCSISAHGLVILRVWGRHMYAGGSTGVATLRRDGFAALTTNSTGRMSTPPVCFHGEGLWVNAQCKSLRAEIQDKNGHALPGLSFQDCICRSVNSTKQQVLWNSAVSLHAISGKPVRIAFELEQGKLFSFWISNDKSGSSGGYLAAGSVQHSSIKDETYE